MIRDEIEQFNKAAILSALKQADIHLVVVEYYGEGDSGGIEMLEGYRDGTKVPFDDNASVVLKSGYYNYLEKTETITEKSYGLEEAIREFSYSLIEVRHGGWENNDGGRGEIKICAKPGAESVTLEHADYYREEHLSEYTI